jgi:(1->4)-alpha-D-glucan 1-alpha-D-glucosylmutase
VAERRAPSSTYRLQLIPDFGFAEAARLADYLADLGVSHAYLSPILAAVPGSGHGYDVTDHSRVRDELGGEDGFRHMAERFAEQSIGVVVDVVPNHMAVHQSNRQLWDVLASGQQSRYAHWFDIDWTAQDGKFLLPILGDDGLSAVTVDGPVLRYHDHVFPLREGSSRPDEQHYRLAHWRTASTELNWRRFFDVTTLIGIRQEDPDVFAASHEVLLRLHEAGYIDGFRVDHPDGLADPRGYFDQLAAATGGAWVVAEKILTRDEELPRDWRCDGTTGYDVLALVDGLFLDPAGASALAGLYGDYVRHPAGTFAQVADVAKREIAERTFTAELVRLARLLPHENQEDVHAVLVELLASFRVYRGYVHPGEVPPPAAAAAVTEAARAAWRNLPSSLHSTLDVVTAAVLDGGPAELIVRFEQTTGPVQAKGVEDTAGYRWPRLVSLNEVGSDPDRFGVAPAEFHDAAASIAATWPHTLTTLSTHDTKRQEDVRARLAVLAERHEEWARAVAAWREVTGPAPDPDIEYLTWQTLAGAWPVGGDRLDGYLTKAMREAKTGTSWTDPDAEYEAAVLAFARGAPADSVAAFVAAIAPDARVNTLGAKLVQLTMPGVPDVYQGCELTGYALVDPDNRRPVDYQRARTPLDEEKLLVTRQALRLRRRHPDWFEAGYAAMTADGPAAGHAVAFRRGGAVTIATRLPAGLRKRGGWSDTSLRLPGHNWRDVLTGTLHATSGPLLADLTAQLPVALLVEDEDGE